MNCILKYSISGVGYTERIQFSNSTTNTITVKYRDKIIVPGWYCHKFIFMKV